MGTSRITVKDLSQLSGYSVSTVSKALNDKRDISKDTKREIRAIANRFNYTPNKYAVALRANSSKAIGILLPKVTIRSFNQSLFYLQQIAERHGYKVFICQTYNSNNCEDSYLRKINDGTVDGIFVINDLDEQTKPKYDMDLPVMRIQITNNLSEQEIEKVINHNFYKFQNLIAL